MLSRFWCQNCKWDLTINVETQGNKCPRCKCGVSLDYHTPNKNAGAYPNKIAPSYGPGVNFGLNKKQSGVRTNQNGRNS